MLTCTLTRLIHGNGPENGTMKLRPTKTSRCICKRDFDLHTWHILIRANQATLATDLWTSNKQLIAGVFPGGGVLPSSRLTGMCRYMGSHFQNWINYDGATFSLDLLWWDRTFSGFGGSKCSDRWDFKNGKIFTWLSFTNVSVHFTMT